VTRVEAPSLNTLRQAQRPKLQDRTNFFMTNFLHKHDLPADLELGNSIAIDTETMGLNLLRDRLCLIQISSGDGNAHLVQFEAGKYEAPNLKKLLSDEKVLKIFHFARFDLAAIHHYLNVEMKNIYCTKIASRLTRTYTDSHGLKALCDEMLNVELSKKQQSSDWGVENLSNKQIDYAASDVLYLHKLKEKFDEMLKRAGRLEDFKRCTEFLPTRAKLDLQGFASVDMFAH
jgi:ribonuclease D